MCELSFKIQLSSAALRRSVQTKLLAISVTLRLTIEWRGRLKCSATGKPGVLSRIDFLAQLKASAEL